MDQEIAAMGVIAAVMQGFEPATVHK